MKIYEPSLMVSFKGIFFWLIPTQFPACRRSKQKVRAATQVAVGQKKEGYSKWLALVKGRSRSPPVRFAAAFVLTHTQERRQPPRLFKLCASSAACRKLLRFAWAVAGQCWLKQPNPGPPFSDDRVVLFLKDPPKKKHRTKKKWLFSFRFCL